MLVEVNRISKCFIAILLFVCLISGGCKTEYKQFPKQGSISAAEAYAYTPPEDDLIYAEYSQEQLVPAEAEDYEIIWGDFNGDGYADPLVYFEIQDKVYLHRRYFDKYYL